MQVGTFTIDDFLNRLGSSDPTPGGGSLAALSGAMAAAMLAMVCNLTIGRPRYTDVETEVQAILAEALGLQRRLVDLTDADMAAYGSVRDAYRLPRGTDEEKVARSATIETSMTHATEVPLDTVQAARALVDLAARAAKSTNTNALGDVAVAVHLAAAATRGASEQARLNLASLTSQSFVHDANNRLSSAEAGIDATIAQTLADVRARAG